MTLAPDRSCQPRVFRRRCRPGVTLIEVLLAIFITGVGLLALLTLFPLGVLRMAEAIKDDRAAALAVEAAEFSAVGQDLVSRTKDFVFESLANQSADPKAAAELQFEYEILADWAAELEVGLIDLRPHFRSARLKRQFLKSLAEIRAIRAAAGKMVELLSLLDDADPPK